jgi:hypothetical protein
MLILTHSSRASFGIRSAEAPNGPKFMKLLRFALTIAAWFAVGSPAPTSGQASSEKTQILWKETLTSAAKGTRIAVPSSILANIRANPDDCLLPSPAETMKVDAYQKRIGNLVLLAIRGRGSCFCSPTGNCSFWLYRSQDGKNNLLLQTEMVQEFGFLSSMTKGLPDVVLWSHDSADRFPGAMWKFNGAEYVSECSWEIVSTFRDIPNQVAQRIESHVESNTCKLKIVPESEAGSTNSSSKPN